MKYVIDIGVMILKESQKIGLDGPGGLREIVQLSRHAPFQIPQPGLSLRLVKVGIYNRVAP